MWTRGEVILYESRQGKVCMEVHHEDETLWLSQRQMAELFGVEVPTVIHHLKEIYDSAELAQEATTRKLRVVRTEGNRSVSREIAHDNLDAIILGWLPREQHAGDAVPHLGNGDVARLHRQGLRARR